MYRTATVALVSILSALLLFGAAAAQPTTATLASATLEEGDLGPTWIAEASGALNEYGPFVSLEMTNYHRVLTNGAAQGQYVFVWLLDANNLPTADFSTEAFSAFQTIAGVTASPIPAGSLGGTAQAYRLAGREGAADTNGSAYIWRQGGVLAIVAGVGVPTETLQVWAEQQQARLLVAFP